MDDQRRQFGVKVYGTVAVVKAVPPDSNQSGDPALATQDLLKVLDSDNPPVHLVLGSDALRLIEQDRERLQSDLAAWTSLTVHRLSRPEPTNLDGDHDRPRTHDLR
jgi:hypothetical protein